MKGGSPGAHCTELREVVGGYLTLVGNRKRLIRIRRKARVGPPIQVSSTRYDLIRAGHSEVVKDCRCNGIVGTK